MILRVVVAGSVALVLVACGGESVVGEARPAPTTGGRGAASVTSTTTEVGDGPTEPAVTSPSDAPVAIPTEVGAAPTESAVASPSDAPVAIPTGGPTHASGRSSPTAPPPEAEPWRPGPTEPYPNAKRTAAAVVGDLTTWESGETLDEVLADVTTDPDRRRALREVVAPLRVPGAWSRGTVEYPELAGIEPDRVALMVVVEQLVGTPDGRTRATTRTMDVRLRLRGDSWAFERLASIGGTPPGSGDVSPAARAVLEDPRIWLPDSARWDIRRGDVDPVLLRLMSDIAERHRYRVVVLSSGHPVNVFGTDILSGHTKGLAVDIRELDGTPIVDMRDDDSPARALVDWLYRRPEVTVIGSPWALDGFGGRSFTDDVHLDHLHVTVRPSGGP